MGCYKVRFGDYRLAHYDDFKYFDYFEFNGKKFRNYVGIKKFTMKNISASGMHHYLKEQTVATGLDLKNYLKSEAGAAIMDKYGYRADNRVDNILHKYRQYFN